MNNKLNIVKVDKDILSKIINSAHDSIVITDVEGNIIYVNDKFTKVTGYTVEEAIGQNPRILKTDSHDDKFYEYLWGKISSGEIYECEFKNKKKDGSFYWEFARISPVFDENGTIKYFFAVKKEIEINIESNKELISLLCNYSGNYLCIKNGEYIIVT